MSEADKRIPDESVGLQAQLEQHKQAAQWHEASETLLQLLDREEEPIRRGVLASEAARISREHLQAPENAVVFLDYALDAYMAGVGVDTIPAGALAAFRSLEAILTAGAQWKELEHAYRKMITRLQAAGPGFDKVQAEVFAKLGAHFLRLDMESDAVTVLQQASALDPVCGGLIGILGDEASSSLDPATPVSAAQHAALPWNKDDPRMNDPIGLGLGPPDEPTKP